MMNTSNARRINNKKKRSAKDEEGGHNSSGGEQIEKGQTNNVSSKVKARQQTQKTETDYYFTT